MVNTMKYIVMFLHIFFVILYAFLENTNLSLLFSRAGIEGSRRKPNPHIFPVNQKSKLQKRAY